MIKAVGFDIGHTLIDYEAPMNWSSLYRPAIERTMHECAIGSSDIKIQGAISILTKYNTRVNPREIEVSSNTIFGEIFDSWHADSALIDLAKESFYSFFLTNAVPFPETEVVLQRLKAGGMKIGLLTNVAYGMDNKYSLKDIEAISKFIDIVLTSVDVGFRKPNTKGYEMLLEAFGVQPSEMLFVGDEEADILGSNRLGIGSVLVNRSDRELDYGQKFTINSLLDIMSII